MTNLELFPPNLVVGVFRGFREGGLEFHADLVLPYRNDFQSIPMHGQFLLVQLETPDEAVLGRIASLSADGRLAAGSGEEFNIRAVREQRAIPEDLRERYLKYRINIRVLGVLRKEGSNKLTFVASHRRLPHVGSPVAFPSPAVLCEIAGHNVIGAPIGHFALGEYIYAGEKATLIAKESWMQIRSPEVLIHFPLAALVSRRSFIFARAGFGKSNLNKLLFSELYKGAPTVTKRGGRHVPVGTVIFDPDGEYFWPDDRGRPGLCDVPDLRDQVVVFTPRIAPSDFYRSFVAGGIKLDLRRLRPADVISIGLDAERQDQQNVRKLRGLNQDKWSQLVDLIHAFGNSASPDTIRDLLALERDQQMEVFAARANMTTIVQMLHSPDSLLMDLLMNALEAGKLCVIDVSQMRGSQALALSGLILKRIFDHNQEQFVKKEPKTIPTIAVIEEAQSVLNERASGAQAYIAWVKEGRKYDLGAVLVTQQPGSIPVEILSQGDNWFLFHLLSATDLQNVHRANAHFSDDILSSLLNEPIAGQGVFWSSAADKPYPLSIRVLSFERMYQALDPHYSAAAVQTFAASLAQSASAQRERIVRKDFSNVADDVDVAPGGSAVGRPLGVHTDILSVSKIKAINAFKEDKDLLSRIQSDAGVPWGQLKAFFNERLPDLFSDKDQLAFDLIAPALTDVFGPQDQGWHSYRPEGRSSKWVRSGAPR